MAGVEQNRYKTNNGCIKHLPQTGLVDSTMPKALFLGVVSLGCFAPDWCSTSITMLTVMVNLP